MVRTETPESKGKRGKELRFYLKANGAKEYASMGGMWLDIWPLWSLNGVGGQGCWLGMRLYGSYRRFMRGEKASMDVES